ncbi:carotenoid biosynthesis protein [uncultured Legionella sp.]|uniref:carotenoid biosynthesis protein n=1 Tax=uncultured Legionella sp. TaxID=210934 RepID=UPI0026373C39|nr:carotenoid biosynthesis protein [uncultured Legionella sp.]
MTYSTTFKNGFNAARWFIILIYLVITVVCAFGKTPFINEIAPIISILTIFSAVWFHGLVRYGTKNLIVFFLVTWIVSNFFEALSIQVGFPFGYYYYDKLIGPRLFQVPFIIMLAYFSAGYVSWILANVLLNQYSTRLRGSTLFVVPVIAAFLMVMWDLCMDPLCSTIGSLWVWRDRGLYFGVPLQNYFGWFFVVYIIYQLFALYSSTFYDGEAINTEVLHYKWFWMEAVAVYGILGLTQIVQFIGATDHLETYGSMALISVFTMLFVALISYLKIKENKQLV